MSIIDRARIDRARDAAMERYLDSRHKARQEAMRGGNIEAAAVHARLAEADALVLTAIIDAATVGK